MRTAAQLLLGVWLLFLPAVVHAQASIAGIVKDTSGAVLPGVTVEASSPALIEKTRSVVTDGTGQYRIVDLRPGTYAVTFSLTGFSTAKREGIELTGSFTATINADMRVGSVAETITVSGEAPIVDVQSVRRQVSVSNATLNEIPSARAYAPVLLLMPGIATAAPADTQVTPALLVFSSPGGRGGEGRVQVDGLSTGAALAGAGASSYVADVSNAQEVTFTNQGGLGESETGGGTINVVPRTGGNRFNGSFDSAFVRAGMVSSNYTPELKAQGLATPAGLDEVWDVNFGLGGPIRKDKLWFFTNLRTTGAYYVVPIYPNLNEFDPTKWTYQPDTAHKVLTATSNGNYRNASLRLTFQVTPRNKIGLFWDEQRPCAGASYSLDVDACKYQPDNGDRIGYNTSTASPETVGIWQQPTRAQQATWSSPVTNNLLLEAGFGTWLGRFGNPVGLSGQPGTKNTHALIRMQELCISPCPVNANIAGLTYRSATFGSSWAGTHTWRFSASRVTGAHNMKFGYNGQYLVWDTGSFTNDQNLTYFVNNGSPIQLQQSLYPLKTANRVSYAAFYAQDQWKLGRATLQGALRYDRAWSHYPEQQVGFTTFLPNEAFVYPDTEGVSWNDISPRGGIAYDLFGNGKTSVKVNAGKYLEAASGGGGTWIAPNPTSRLSTTTTRAWTDANRNFVADCNLTNPAGQDLRASGGDSCGPMTVQTFAKNVFTSSVDPALVSGWGKRGSDWAFSASIQHQILPRTSVEVGYNWRALENFTVTDNLAVLATDFDRFSVTAPADVRLPGGGGYVVGDLYNVSNVKFGQNNNMLTRTNSYGRWTQHYNGMLAQATARPRNGLTVQGGFNVGKTVTDTCEVRSQLIESAPTNPYCLVDSGFVTRATALASYTIPRIEVLLSTTFRSEQGSQLAANWSVPSAIAAQTLGRPLSGSTPTVSVNLITPGTLYGNRINLMDFRIAKVIRVGRTRTNIGVDVFNLMNSDAVLSYNNTYTPASATAGSTWLVPLSVVTPRFVKFSAHVEF